MATAEKAPGLTDQQLQEILGLIEGADSVELKLTVPDEDRRSTVQALGLDALDCYIRQVFFFDTPDLKLNRAGLVELSTKCPPSGPSTSPHAPGLT